MVRGEPPPDAIFEPGPLPWLPVFHEGCMPIPSGGPTFISGPTLLSISPTMSKITPAKVTPIQSGHLREANRAPPSSAKWQLAGRQRHQSSRPGTNRRRR